MFNQLWSPWSHPAQYLHCGNHRIQTQVHATDSDHSSFIHLTALTGFDQRDSTRVAGFSIVEFFNLVIP